MESQLHDDKISYEQPPTWPKEMDSYYADQLAAQFADMTKEASLIDRIRLTIGTDTLTALEKVNAVRTMIAIFDFD